MSQQAIEQFNNIYMELRAPLQHYLYRLTRDTQDAADIAQETFLRMYDRKVRPETAKAWLYRTGYHLFVDGWRKKRKVHVVPLDHMSETTLEKQFIPEEVLLRSELEEEVRNAMKQLKPRDQAVLTLLKREGASYQEIADRLGFSETLVKSVVFRARGRMRRMMQSRI